jgi:diguanylate cyclase (GGDEF)-like protein/PAS domain S-box-containing protein
LLLLAEFDVLPSTNEMIFRQSLLKKRFLQVCSPTNPSNSKDHCLHRNSIYPVYTSNTDTSDAAALKRRSPLIVAGLIIFLVGSLYTVSSSILLNSFVQVEQQTVKKNVQQLLATQAHDLEVLQSTVMDYARWDDTYWFMQQPEQKYIDTNYTSDNLNYLDINLVIALDASGRVLFKKGFDLQTEQEVPISQELEQRFLVKNQIIKYGGSNRCYSGVSLNFQQALMIVSCPVTTSLGEGPSPGILIMGRYFNVARLNSLIGISQLSAEVYAMQGTQLPSDVQTARSALLATGEIVIQPLTQQLIAGYALLEDIHGEKSLILKVTMPRVIYAQGLLSRRYLGGSLLILSSLFGGVIWLLLRQLVTYIAQRDRVQQALAQEKELAQTTLHSIGDGVITTNSAGQIESLNPVAEQLLGWQSQEVQGLPLSEIFKLVEEETHKPLANPVEQVLKQESHLSNQDNGKLLLSRDGRYFAIDTSVAPICARHGQVVGAVLVFRDMTQSRHMARQLAWQASYDALTGLLNRYEFKRYLELALHSASHEQLEHCLCFLDLDRFKPINDTCGHIAGDELLRQIAALLQSQVRKTDIVARLGGDEFAILLHQCSQAQAYKLAQLISSSVQAFRFIWQDKVFSIGASIGLVPIASEQFSASDVMMAADAACYVAKNRGRDRIHVYQVDDQELKQHRSELQWVNRLNLALENNQFCLFQQPIAPLNANRAVGECYEVLLRMIDDNGQLILPGAFIPAAERYDLMPAVDRWVIRTLFATQAEHYRNAWQKSQEDGRLYLYTINLSGASINDDRFIEFLLEQFTCYNVPPQVICFEITETVAIANLKRATHFIQQFKALGCSFALDDFGSGMSSFVYLKNLPIDYLKIVGELVKDIVDDPVSFAIVDAINRTGTVMNIQTIAEFVANAAIKAKLSKIGVNYVQGYAIVAPYLLE